MPNYIDGQATAVGGEVHVIIRSVEPEIFDAIQNPYSHNSFTGYNLECNGFVFRITDGEAGIYGAYYTFVIQGSYENHPVFPAKTIIDNIPEDRSPEQIAYYINYLIHQFNSHPRIQ